MARPNTPEDGLEAIEAAARILGLDVPEACREGVTANLALLQSHVAVLATASAEDEAAA